MCFLRFLFNWKMVQMNFIFILPIKMAIFHQVLSLTVAAVEKTKGKNIIELQYCTGMSRMKYKNIFFFNFQKIGEGP